MILLQLSLLILAWKNINKKPETASLPPTSQYLDVPKNKLAGFTCHKFAHHQPSWLFTEGSHSTDLRILSTNIINAFYCWERDGTPKALKHLSSLWINAFQKFKHSSILSLHKNFNSRPWILKFFVRYKVVTAVTDVYYLLRCNAMQPSESSAFQRILVAAWVILWPFEMSVNFCQMRRQHSSLNSSFL